MVVSLHRIMHQANLFPWGGQRTVLLLLSFIPNQLVIPIAVRREHVTAEALGLLPDLAAVWTNAPGIEGVPTTTATYCANPTRTLPGFPIAFWTINPDLASLHWVCPRQYLRVQEGVYHVSTSG